LPEVLVKPGVLLYKPGKFPGKISFLQAISADREVLPGFRIGVSNGSTEKKNKPFASRYAPFR
jgi:hypothetical protein